MIFEPAMPHAPRPAAAPSPDALASEALAVEILPAESARERFDRIRAACRQAGNEGRLEDALELAQTCLELAEQIGEPALIDLALCNRSAFAFELGRFDDIADLRVVLMRNHGADTSFAAAYNLSCAYEQKKQFKKALFYGRIARDRALAADNQDYLAKSFNSLGSSRIGDSYFREAIEDFEKALDLLPDELSVTSAAPRVNRAYCRLLLDEHASAFGDLFACLRWYRQRGYRAYEVWPRLFLCYGYLDLGRLRYAWHHGRRALEIADEIGMREAAEAAYFLLGEVEKAAGDYQAAATWVDRMRNRFRPNLPELSAASTVGLARVVNLRA